MLRLLVPFSCAAALAAQTPSSDVAVGVFPFLVGNMDGRVTEIVTNCQTYGIDTLYVSVYRATGPSTGDLWITDNAGDWNAAWGPVRPGGAGINLQTLIPACHAANIRVVGILKCFADTVQPDSAAHKQYLLDVIDYFVDAWLPNGQPIYDLDGLALDYIRYVGGTNVNASNVTNFLADVRQHVGSLSLHAYLIASRYTFDGGTYNGQFQSYATVINSFASQYGQHWEQMAQYIDVMMPMAYTADGSIYNSYALHQAYVRQCAAYARTACQIAGYPARRVCPTIRTYADTSETTTDQTVEASITGALLGGGDGYQAFRYQHLVNHPSWWTKMAQYAVAGCNWPMPIFTASAPRLTTTVDPTASRDADQTSGSLQVRFDYNGDRLFDTPWVANAPAVGLARYPGTWQATMQVKDAGNHVSVTRRRFNAGSAVAVVPGNLSATYGGSVQIQFDVGTAGAGNIYLALATLSGTAPGFVWQPGFPVPLNVDFVTNAFATDPNGGVLANGLGVFDVNGRATAVLTLPPQLVQPFVWQSVHWNFLSMDLFGQPRCVGDSKPMVITP
jgi:hypothetical protein